LLYQGERPSIVRIRPASREEMIMPVLFPNKHWYYHDVCSVGNTMWDPMMGEPLSRDQYFPGAFGQFLPVEERVSFEVLSRRHARLASRPLQQSLLRLVGLA